MIGSSVLKALVLSLKHRGLFRTVHAIPSYIRYRISVYFYYRRLFRVIEQDGFDKTHGTETSQIIEGFHMDAVGKKGEPITRCETLLAKWTREILQALPIKNHEDYIFIDVGSGKGRVMLVASELPFKKIVGVDISSECVATTRKNIEIYKDGVHKDRFELHCMDVEDYELPPEDTILYAYNPFGRDVMKRFVTKLETSLRDHPRKLLFLYVFPCQREILTEASFLKEIPICGTRACLFSSVIDEPERQSVPTRSNDTPADQRRPKNSLPI